MLQKKVKKKSKKSPAVKNPRPAGCLKIGDAI
jgi:hypothetical protein